MIPLLILAALGYIGYKKYYEPNHSKPPALPPAPPGVKPATPTAAAQAANIVATQQLGQSAALDPGLQIGINPDLQGTPKQPDIAATSAAIELVRSQAANALLAQGNTPEATAALLAVESLPHLD